MEELRSNQDKCEQVLPTLSPWDEVKKSATFVFGCCRDIELTKVSGILELRLARFKEGA